MHAQAGYDQMQDLAYVPYAFRQFYGQQNLSSFVVRGESIARKKQEQLLQAAKAMQPTQALLDRHLAQLELAGIPQEESVDTIGNPPEKHVTDGTERSPRFEVLEQ